MRKPDEPIDLFMVEIMHMKHRFDSDTRLVSLYPCCTFAQHIRSSSCVVSYHVNILLSGFNGRLEHVLLNWYCVLRGFSQCSVCPVCSFDIVKVGLVNMQQS